MKVSINLILMLSLILLVTTAQAAPTGDPLEKAHNIYGNNIVPDVMGNVNIHEDYEGPFRRDSWGLDLITPYPGYPVNVSSWSHEGGVYYNMDGDDDLEIIYYIGQSVHVLNLDGSYVTGWPQSTTYYSSGAPAIGDIDGDGDDEIVVAMSYTMTTGGVDAFELDGTRVSGFPLTSHGYVSRTPTLGDLDGDGALEIIVNKRMWPLGEWWVYSGDGTVFPGWPQAIDHVPASSSAVGDITGDGVPEVIGESYDGLYAWDINGNVLPGFPFMMPYSMTNSYSAPILADLDNDGLNEIIFGTHGSGGGYVFVLNEDGTEMPGWPKSTGSWIYGPPAIGYVDGDAVLDVVIGDQTLSPSPMNFIYGWDANGNTLSGFPIGPLNAINNQVALADLDGDGMVELIVDDNTMITATYEGKYLAFNHDGTPLAGWPLSVTGCTMFHMTCLTDVNHDGFVDLVGAGSYASEGWSNIYLWDTDYVYDEANIIVPCFQYNLRHDGVYPGGTVTPPDIEVTLTPVNPPIVIPSAGGSFDFNGEINNIGTATAYFDAWTEIDLPSGGTVSPVILRENLWMNAGGSISRDLMQEVPGNAPAGAYTYRMLVGDYPNTVYASDEFDFSKSGTDGNSSFTGWNLSGWEEDAEALEDIQANSFLLHPCNPNPFNPVTTIPYSLQQAGSVEISVYNIAGQIVAELVNGWRDAGRHEVTFDASHLSAGIYIARIEAGNYVASQKMVLVK